VTQHLRATRQAVLETDKRAAHNDAHLVWASLLPLEIMSIDRLLYGFERQEFSTSFHSGDVASYIAPTPLRQSLRPIADFDAIIRLGYN
jgi:hypothetical protein